MHGPDWITPSERRLAILLFALTVLGTAVRWGERTSPAVRRWLDAVSAPGDSLEAPPRAPAGPSIPVAQAGPLPLPPAGPGGDPALKSPELVTAARVSEDPAQEAAPLDPNRAGSAAFEALPGVGPVLARRIVEERERSGPFRSPEDLLRVRGIGPSTLRRLRPYLRFDTGASPGAGS